MFRRFVCFWLCLISFVFAFGQKPIPAGESSPTVIGNWEGTLDAGQSRSGGHGFADRFAFAYG
jgi:hypothetical protein